MWRHQLHPQGSYTYFPLARLTRLGLWIVSITSCERIDVDTFPCCSDSGVDSPGTEHVPADATGNEAACIHFLHVHFDIAKWFALAVLCLEVCVRPPPPTPVVARSTASC